MNCRELSELLANGQPVTAEAEAHVKSCPSCGPMALALNQLGHFSDVRNAQLESISALIERRLVPVRPLPSNLVVWLIIAALFVCLSVVLTIPFGFQGLTALGLGQRVAYLGVVLAVASLLVHQAVLSFIPGSRRLLNDLAIIGASLGLLVLVVVNLFASFGDEQFVRHGIPCLRLGTACALITAVLGTALMRRGFASAPLKAGAIVGVLSAMVGVTVLALHCAQQNTLHIVVWHFGTILIGSIVGAAAGWTFSRYGTSSRVQRG